MADSPPVLGRPTLYRKVYDKQALKLCLLGATDAELAAFFDISRDTIMEWRAAHRTFSDSIARGKVAADAEVAHSLYQRAIGATWVEEQAVKIRTGQYTEEVTVTSLEKAAPPDTPAASLWLRNRQPLKWRDKAQVELSGAGGGPIIIVTGVPRPGDEATGVPPQTGA